MSDRTGIAWTNATWNPVRGCAIVSPGCTNCYAMKQAHRFSGKGKAYEGLTKMTKGGPVWTGEVRTVPQLLDWPLRKKKPLRIFVNSMSDLFHEDVPEEFIAAVFGVMAMANWHDYQVLTKRPERAVEFFRWLESQQGGPLETCLWHARKAIGPELANRFDPYPDKLPEWPLENVWLGVSVEDQARAEERIPLLLQTPAAVRWISAEPLLGPISFEGCWVPHANPAVHENWLEKIDWVVVGGESGPGARPFDLAWARSLRDQCRAAGVPYFLKQFGAYVVGDANDPRNPRLEGDTPMVGDGRDGAIAHFRFKDRKGGDPAEWPEDLRVREYPR